MPDRRQTEHHAASRWHVCVKDDFIHAATADEARADFIAAIVEDGSLVEVVESDPLPWATEDGIVRVVEQQVRLALSRWREGLDCDADFLCIEKHLAKLDEIREAARA
jgi:hypothetical protein